MASQKDIKSRISSVKNIRKITRAMEMVAAARLRRAEQRIEALRPYADAHPADDPARLRGRREHPQPAAAPGAREPEDASGILLVTGDRGLAGAFNSQIIRAGNRRARELEAEGKDGAAGTPSGTRGVSSLEFRGFEVAGASPASPTAPPSRTRATSPTTLTAAYVDGEVDRVEIIYNHYISPLDPGGARTRRCCRSSRPTSSASDDEDDEPRARSSSEEAPSTSRALWIYEPEPGGDPRAARAGLRRDLDLPGAARVDGVRARRPHDAPCATPPTTPAS